MKKIIKLIVLFLALTLFTGCDNKILSNENPKIYTSVYPIKYVVERLYGEHANIISIYPNDSNPYSYELTNKQIKDYSDCDYVIYNSLNKENQYVSKMLNHNRKLKIIAATEKIEYETNLNEVWINPSSMLMIAQNIKNGLEGYIDSSYLQKEISDNYNNLKIELSSIDADLKEIVENADNKHIVVASDELKILSKYGFEVISIDKDSVTEKSLADASSLFNSNKASYIIMTNDTEENDTIKSLMSKYGVKTLKIDTLKTLSSNNKVDNKDYITIMKENIDILKEELY